MSTDTIIDLRGRATFPEKVLPFIVWERKTRKPDESIVTEKQPMRLFDRHGSPHIWLDPPTINYYVTKGWKIADFGNFDFPEKYLGKPSEHLNEIAAMVANQSGSYQQIASQVDALKEKDEKLAEKDAEIEARDAEIAALQAQLAKSLKSNPPSTGPNQPSSADKQAKPDEKPADDSKQASGGK